MMGLKGTNCIHLNPRKILRDRCAFSYKHNRGINSILKSRHHDASIWNVEMLSSDLYDGQLVCIPSFGMGKRSWIKCVCAWPRCNCWFDSKYGTRGCSQCFFVRLNGSPRGGALLCITFGDFARRRQRPGSGEALARELERPEVTPTDIRITVRTWALTSKTVNMTRLLFSAVSSPTLGLFLHVNGHPSRVRHGGSPQRWPYDT